MIAVDSSVLVAAFATWHEAHLPSFRAIERGVHLVAHAALETYSVLTRLPPPHRIAPEAVHTFLGGISSLPWLTLGPAAQLDLLENLAREAIDGGAVYDALVGATSTAAGATLLTRDVRAGRTYRRLGVTFELLA